MTEPLDYRAPNTPGGRPLFSVVAFIVVAVPILVVVFILFFVIPHFEAIFHDFGTKLPAMTQLLLDTARFGRGLGLIMLAAIPIVSGFIAPRVVPNDPRNRNLRWILALVLAIVVLLVVIIIVMIALYLPMMTLIENVSAPHK